MYMHSPGRGWSGNSKWNACTYYLLHRLMDEQVGRQSHRQTDRERRRERERVLEGCTLLKSLRIFPQIVNSIILPPNKLNNHKTKVIVCEKILLKHHLRCIFRKESNRNGTKIIIRKKIVTGSPMTKMKITIMM